MSAVDRTKPLAVAAVELGESAQANRQRKRRVPTAAEPVAQAAGNAAHALPPLPEALADLPDGLGFLQNWIVGRMTYPCRFVAGWNAITTLTAFAQTNFTINSQAGLGLNEFYMTLARTGFGKESMREPVPILSAAVLDRARGATNVAQALPAIENSAPASAQGLHRALEIAGEKKALPSVYMLADEFASWLRAVSARGKNDGNQFQALSFAMQLYSKALGTAHPGRAVTNSYADIENPRFLIFSTTTPQAAFDSMSRDLAEMGAWNRFVTFLAPDEVPKKRYSGLRFEPCPDAVGFLYRLLMRGPERLQISEGAFKTYVQRDRDHAEPIRQSDALMGGRLAEQAIKMSGLFCLSRGDSVISDADMRRAFDIRLGLYHRDAAAAGVDGAMEGRHETAEALEQIRAALERHGRPYKSSLQSFSRKYRGLSTRDRQSVLLAASREGWAAELEGSPHILCWVGE